MSERELATFVVTLLEQVAGAGNLPDVWPQTLEHLETMGYKYDEVIEKFRAIYEAAGLEYPE